MSDLNKCSKLFDSVKNEDIPKEFWDEVSFYNLMNQQLETQKFIQGKRNGFVPTNECSMQDRAKESIYWIGATIAEAQEMYDWFEEPVEEYIKRPESEKREITLEAMYEYTDMLHFIMNSFIYTNPNLDLYKHIDLEKIVEDALGDSMDWYDESDAFRCLIVNLGKLINFLPYKNWKSYTDYKFDEEEYKEIVYKIMYQFVRLGLSFWNSLDHVMDEKLIGKLYFTKNVENWNRQKQGGKYEA